MPQQGNFLCGRSRNLQGRFLVQLKISQHPVLLHVQYTIYVPSYIMTTTWKRELSATVQGYNYYTNVASMMNDVMSKLN